MFVWMSKEHLCVLVYVVTVMHSMQAGYMDKAQKYTEKAFLQIEKLKRQLPNLFIVIVQENNWFICFYSIWQPEYFNLFPHSSTRTFDSVSIGHGSKRSSYSGSGNSSPIVRCRASSFACRPFSTVAYFAGPVCYEHEFYGSCRSSIQRCPKSRINEQIFPICLFQFFLLFQSTTDRELWTFANLNLAIVYLRMKREGDFNKLIENINPETLPSHSHSLRAAAFYVQGLQCFFQARYNEAKYAKLHHPLKNK